MQVTFKRDIIKFEFILINIKIPENSPWTPPTHPSREKNYSPDTFSGSAHACSIYKLYAVWVRIKRRTIALVEFFSL